MYRIIERIKKEKIIAIVRGLPEEKIIKTCRALEKGGISAIEVTFNQSSPTCIEDTCKGIQSISDQLEGVCVGAGTVMTLDQLEKAVEAGAKYIISPHTDINLIKRTKELGVVSIPGALTPTEVAMAYDAGADFVKLFPAGNLGIGYIKALMAPINHIPMLAVGGIDAGNTREFLQLGLAGVGVGSSLVNMQLIEADKYDELTALASEFSRALKGD